MKPVLPPTLATMVLAIRRAGKPLGWMELYEACEPTSNGHRPNTFRFLLRRGLIRNVVKPYKPGERFTGPRDPRYALTPAGVEAAKLLEKGEDDG